MADEQYEAALRLVLQDELTNALSRARSRSNTEARQTARGWTGAFSRMQTGAKKAADEIMKGQRQIKSGALTAASGVAVAAPLALAAKAAGVFQDGMAEVATLTNRSAADITASFGPIVNATRRTFGVEAQDTIKALYDGFSAGVPQTLKGAKAYLDAASQMKVGGATNMAAAGAAIMTVQNAWKFQGLSFKEVSDQMFSGVQGGVTTIGELSASIGNAASTVAGARVPFYEFMGSVAALTSAKGAGSTSRVMTELAASIIAIQKPSAEAAKLYKKIGAEVDPLTFKTRGYAGSIDYIRDKVNAYTKDEAERIEIFQKLIGSIEAGKAVFALAGDQNKKLKEEIDNAKDSTNGMGVAARKMTEGPMHQYRQSVEDTKIAWETFGTVTAPIFSEMMSVIQLIVSDVTEWIEENRELTETISMIVLAISGLLVVLGALKMLMGVVTMIKAVTTAFWAMNSAILANPVTWVVAAIALIAGALYMLITRTEDVTLFFQYMGLNIQKVFNEMQLTVFKALKYIDELLTPVTSTIKELTGVDLSINWSSNIKEQQQDLKDVESSMTDIFNTQRAVTARREELSGDRTGKAIETLKPVGTVRGDVLRTPASETKVDIGGITNVLQLPDVPISQQSLDQLGLKVEQATIKAIKKAAKQKSREKIGGK